MTGRKIVLNKSSDWDSWISFIRTRAIALDVWNLIDPNYLVKPVYLLKPTPLFFPVPTEDDPVDEIALRAHNISSSNFKTLSSEYKEQRKAFGDIVTIIQESISTTNAVYIERLDAHPYDLLTALKKKLAPTDDARSLSVESEYHRVCKGPKNQDVEKWLDEWLRAYSKAVELEVFEATGRRPIRDFLMAIKPINPSFVEVNLSNSLLGIRQPDIFDLVEAFRHSTRLSQELSHGKNATHSAFSANEPSNPSSKPSSRSSSRSPSFKGNPVEPSECVCGLKEWIADCLYLNPKKRSSSWKPDPEIKKKVEEAMKDSRTKAWVERSIKRRKEFDERVESHKSSSSSESPRPSSSVHDSGAFPVTEMETSFASNSYPLRSSWILDHGASTHVCNHSMKDRFIKDRDGNGQSIVAGNSTLAIEAYGHIKIEFEGVDGKNSMTLLNVSYVHDFMTNIVSGWILHSKGLDFDSQHSRLHRDGSTIGYARPYHRHFVMEDNTKDHHSFATSASSAKKGTVEDWHQLLAHASNEVIQNLEKAVDGVKITDNAKAPKTHECETCALAKSHRLVSKSTAKSEKSEKPFHRITYDLMQMTTAMNKDQWISHLACSEYDFNLVFTHRYKSEATTIIKKGLNIISTRFDSKVVFFRSDGERALGKEFDDLMLETGITYEPSSPYTPEQNGSSERKGGLLAMKARALRIDANLPIHLWPWIVKASGYIMNRTPMKKHEWRTPFEKITNERPFLGYFRKFGCKAYSLDKQIPRKNKLQERAHIGFLLGYDSTNIFFIWIPSQHKVIRTRDVIFDETSYYDPSEIDLAQILKEPMLETTFDVPALPDLHITEIDSDEEEEEIKENTITQGDGGNVPGKEKETGETMPDLHQHDHLPSPAPTSSGSTTPQYTPNSTPSPPPPPPPPPAPQTASRTTAPRNIEGNVSDSNILPEGVGRIKKKRHIHAIGLEDASLGNIDTYHLAFTCFMASRNYYEDSIGSIDLKNLLTFDPTARPVDSKDSSPHSHPHRHHRDDIPTEPQNYRQMIKHPHALGFQQAVQVELQQLVAMKVWKEASYDQSRSAGKKPIPTTWVFKYKFDNQGYLVKYKARLCVRGDLQSTFQDTYAATLAIRIFRVLMAVVAAFDLETRQYDAINAFVNSDIDEPTYCIPPEGWKEGSNILLLLLKALYGLKQAPALWFKHLSRTLSDLGLNSIPGIECLFINDYMLLFFFVDDIAVIYDRRFTKEVDEFQARFFQTYEMRYLGEVQWFLGIRITRDRATHRLSLCQDSYIEKLIAKFNVNISSKAPGAPLSNYETFSKNLATATPEQILRYQQKVGSINFSAVNTRPDTSFAASKLSEFLTNPSKEHLEAADRVLRYLGHTKHYSIMFDPQIDDPKTIFLGSSDASYADDVETRHSSQRYCFKLFNGMVDWKASKQKTVTTSSTEAELLAISNASKEILWWTRFFEAISFDTGHAIQVECDNMQTIRAFTTSSNQFTTKLRHVDIHRHWLKQEVKNGNIKIKWTSTISIISDGLTKALSPQRHKEFVKLLGMEERLSKLEDKAEPFI